MAYQGSITTPENRRFDDDIERADMDEGEDDEQEEWGSDNDKTHHA